MFTTVLDHLGTWNPQLLRELKGRLTTRNVGITAVLALLGQLFLIAMYYLQLPAYDHTGKVMVNSRFCTGPAQYGWAECLTGAQDKILINWPLWWLELFSLLSLCGVFLLIVVGSYMLITDLAREQQRGTLNFIRLSPQTAQSILMGKLLGVPALLYVALGLALPLHLGSALQAGVPSALLFSFYGVVTLGTLFYFSSALLYGLAGSVLGSFQSWVGSGIILLFLVTTTIVPTTNAALDAITLLQPARMLHFLGAATGLDTAIELSHLQLDKMYWLGLNAGAQPLAFAGLMGVNFVLWTFWIWQALIRYFHSTGTLISKRQSYWITATWTFLAFSLSVGNSNQISAQEQIQMAIFLGAFILLGIMAALLPQRQSLQDWSRYRKTGIGTLSHDLINHEKSPAILAMAINLSLWVVPMTAWIVFSSVRLPILGGLALTASMILLCTCVAQTILIFKLPKAGVWALCSVGSLVTALPVVLMMLNLRPDTAAWAWIFTVFAWAVEDMSVFHLGLGLMVQAMGMGLVITTFTHQIKKAGTSASKALFEKAKTPLLNSPHS